MWIVGATVVDGTGRDPMPDCAVQIDRGHIVGLGGAPPPGAEVIDCSSLTLTPGLIDAHVHLGLSSSIDDSWRHVLSVAELAADMFANCGQTLEAGFTTVRDTGGIDAGLANVVAAGKVPGPRIIHCGPLHCQTGGHGYYAADWEPSDLWEAHAIPGLRTLSLLSDGADQLRRNVRESFRRGADFLKLCVTGGVVSRHDALGDTQFTIEEIAVAVAEAKARGTYVTVHAHNNAGIRNAVSAGARCVEHGSEIDEETAALMARRGVAHVPTLTVVDELLKRPGGAGLPSQMSDRVGIAWNGQIEAIHVARAAGVRVGLGSDLIGPNQDIRGNELVTRARIETPMDALVSATRINAEILGIGDQTGSIDIGKAADLVAFRGNPLDEPEIFADRDRVVLVVQAGRIVKDRR